MSFVSNVKNKINKQNQYELKSTYFELDFIFWFRIFMVTLIN